MLDNPHKVSCICRIGCSTHLPFGLGGTKWEVLVGVRNLFRDPNDPASVYDELLVVRPPKRVVGGFLVRF